MESGPIVSYAERAKRHVQSNQDVYIGLGIGVCMGTLFVLAFHRRPIHLINTVAPIFNNSNTTELGGYLSKIVRNNVTGEISETVGLAADRAGVPIQVMSKHLNAYPGYEDVRGASYSIIGVGVGS